MKLALISCGRSDYSIYLPLMKKLREDSFFDLEVIAFGTHVSRFYDLTVKRFYEDGLKVAYEIESLILGDSPESVSTGMGVTITKFSSVWARENYDAIIVLGDRFEMFAAIAASIPFNIPAIHLHGGETTLGAIDDKFRHCITSMSTVHFTTTESNKKRVEQILGHGKYVYNFGAPALDNLKELSFLSKEEFKEEWGIDLNIPTVLVTYHPETIGTEDNISIVKELCKAMSQMDMQFVITMPNNDTMGTAVRSEILDFASKSPEKYKTVEVLGTVGYYSCITHCSFMLGNTSSGIIEAASFNKYVIDIGDRQKGRERGKNVFNLPAKADIILKQAEEIMALPPYTEGNIYGDGTASSKMASAIKEYYYKEVMNLDKS